MILSGIKIEEEVRAGNIYIEDFDKKRLNPNSYNLRLADELLVYDTDRADDYGDRQFTGNGVLDMKKESPYHIEKIPEDGLVIYPGVLYLGRTMERTRTDCFVPMLEGRSSVGRLGISIHETAGFGDVGFDGYWTLEISCIQPVIIYPGVEICQIYYHTIQGDYEKYGKSGKYQGNNGIQPSLMYMDFGGKTYRHRHCPFCHYDRGHVETMTDDNRYKVWLTKITPLPAIDLTTGETAKTADPPFYALFMDGEDAGEDILPIRFCPMCGRNLEAELERSKNAD